MGGCCDVDSCTTPGAEPGFRRVLWAALFINAGMFVAELAASFFAGSVSLQADAMDFLGDAANYAVSLAVLTMAPA